MIKESITFKEKEEIFSMLNKMPLFGGLTNKELEFLIPLLTTASFRKGDFIFSQGDSPNNIYIIKTGEVKVIKMLENKEVELAAFSEGCLFGEVELIGILKYFAAARSYTDTTILILSRAALYSLYSKDIKLFTKIILNVAREACRRVAITDEYWLEKLENH